jgi:hypothetical protein
MSVRPLPSVSAVARLLIFFLQGRVSKSGHHPFSCAIALAARGRRATPVRFAPYFIASAGSMNFFTTKLF